MTKSKVEEKAKPIVDFMPGWAREEECFRKAIVRNYNTKRIVEGGWPRNKPTDQWAYENWLSTVVNQETGEFHPQKNEEGIPIKGTGARHVVNVITRVRDAKGKSEYLLAKGSLIGFDVGGIKKQYPISYPERWLKTEFLNKHSFNEKTGASTVQTIGPSGTYDVYQLPFSADNVLKLYEKVEDENVMFVLKDIKTGEARSVNWSSVKDSLDLFCHKPFEYLWKADYMPAPVKAELRQEAIAQGLIHGVASDYQMQSSPSQSSVGVE